MHRIHPRCLPDVLQPDPSAGLDPKRLSIASVGSGVALTPVLHVGRSSLRLSTSSAVLPSPQWWSEKALVGMQGVPLLPISYSGLLFVLHLVLDKDDTTSKYREQDYVDFLDGNAGRASRH